MASYRYHICCAIIATLIIVILCSSIKCDKEQIVSIEVGQKSNSIGQREAEKQEDVDNDEQCDGDGEEEEEKEENWVAVSGGGKSEMKNETKESYNSSATTRVGYNSNSVLTKDNLDYLLDNPVCNPQLKGKPCEFIATCGDFKRGRSAYIVHSMETVPGEFASFAQLVIAGPRHCGGTVVSDWHVITSADCVLMPGKNDSTLIENSDVTIHLGSIYRWPKEDKNRQIYKVAKICLPWNFERTKIINHDIAVLTTEVKIEFNEYIKPACWPYKNRGEVKIFDGECYVGGMGISVQKRVKIPGEKERFVERLSETLDKWRVDMTECYDDRAPKSVLCLQSHVKEKSKTVGCDHDNGGPVLCRDTHNRMTLAGVYSFNVKKLNTVACNKANMIGAVSLIPMNENYLSLFTHGCRIKGPFGGTTAPPSKPNPIDDFLEVNKNRKGTILCDEAKEGSMCRFTEMCGKRNATMRKAYLLNGKDTNIYDWPWFATVMWKNKEPCNGVLVSADHVVTKRNCLHDNYGKFAQPKDVQVLLGSQKWHERPDINRKSYQVIGMCHSTKFPLNDYFMQHDLSVVKLKERVQFGAYIQPACWPYTKRGQLNMNECYAISLGATIEIGNMSQPASEMKQMKVTPAECDDRESDGNICFKSAESGFCHGDAGGPIMCQDAKKQWVAVGVMSHSGWDGDCKAGITIHAARINNEEDIHLAQCVSQPKRPVNTVP